eukprot:9275882-Pyramimonas_sp.AAC.1
MDECAELMDTDRVTLFLDLQKFYGSISFALLKKASQTLDYPAIITLLDVTMYASPRMLNKGRMVSRISGGTLGHSRLATWS